MSELSTFISESAKFMATDRPDIWDLQEALKQLSNWVAEMSSHDEEDSIATGGFELTKGVSEDGDVEYMLSRHILSLNTFSNGEDAYVYNWSKDGKLVDINLNVED